MYMLSKKQLEKVAFFIDLCIYIVYTYICIMVKEVVPMLLSLKKWGNSTAIRLPKALLEEVGIHDNNASFEAEVKNGSIILKEKKKVESLEELFSGFDTESYFKDKEDNLEYDWDEPQGKEIF